MGRLQMKFVLWIKFKEKIANQTCRLSCCFWDLWVWNLALLLLLVVGSGFPGDHDVCHHFGVKGHPETKVLKLWCWYQFSLGIMTWRSSPCWDQKSFRDQILKLWWWDSFSKGIMMEITIWRGCQRSFRGQLFKLWWCISFTCGSWCRSTFWGRRSSKRSHSQTLVWGLDYSFPWGSW